MRPGRELRNVIKKSGGEVFVWFSTIEAAEEVGTLRDSAGLVRILPIPTESPEQKTSPRKEPPGKPKKPEDSALEKAGPETQAQEPEIIEEKTLYH